MTTNQENIKPESKDTDYLPITMYSGINSLPLEDICKDQNYNTSRDQSNPWQLLTNQPEDTRQKEEIFQTMFTEQAANLRMSNNFEAHHQPGLSVQLDQQNKKNLQNKLEVSFYCDDHVRDERMYLAAERYCSVCNLFLCANCVLENHIDHAKQAKMTIDKAIAEKTVEFKRLRDILDANMNSASGVGLLSDLNDLNYQVESVFEKDADTIEQLLTKLKQTYTNMLKTRDHAKEMISEFSKKCSVSEGDESSKKFSFLKNQINNYLLTMEIGEPRAKADIMKLNTAKTLEAAIAEQEITLKQKRSNNTEAINIFKTNTASLLNSFANYRKLPEVTAEFDELSKRVDEMKTFVSQVPYDRIIGFSFKYFNQLNALQPKVKEDDQKGVCNQVMPEKAGASQQSNDFRCQNEKPKPDEDHINKYDNEEVSEEDEFDLLGKSKFDGKNGVESEARNEQTFGTGVKSALSKRMYCYFVTKENELRIFSNNRMFKVPITKFHFSNESERFYQFPENCRFANFEGGLIITGGKMNKQIITSVYILQVFENEQEFSVMVEKAADMSTARDRHNLIFLPDKGLLITNSGFYNKTVEMYTLESNSWYSLTDLTAVRANATMAYINSRYVFTMGGFNMKKDDKSGGEYLNSYEVMDLLNFKSTQKLVTYNYNALRVCAMGLIYRPSGLLMVGGFDGSCFLDTVYDGFVEEDRMNVELTRIKMPKPDIFYQNFECVEPGIHINHTKKGGILLFREESCSFEIIDN